MVYGYHRTSTTDQHLDRGLAAINNYCQLNNIQLNEMFTDQQTGKNFDRPDYLVLKRMVRKGDTLIISEVDRLGRNKEDTLKELQHFKTAGVRVMVLEIPTTLIDYSQHNDALSGMLMDTVNNMLIEMYATLAHAEMLKRERRQREGIAMKVRGDWDDYGRPRAMDYDVFAVNYEKVLSGEVRPFELMRQLGLTKPTYYRYKAEYESKCHVALALGSR